MIRKFLVTLSAAAGLAAVLSIGALAASDGGATVTASALNLRAEAGTDSAILTVAPRGSSVVVRRNVGTDWVQVWYRGVTGYMASEYLSFTDSLNADFGDGTVVGNNVRVRNAPGTGGGILGECENGDVYAISGVSGEWYRIAYKGHVGYINSEYMTLETAETHTDEPTTPASTPAATPGQSIVNTASRFLGTRYVWAGTSPSGFDCSGFVHYVFGQCGYDVNRTAASLYSNGTAVSKDELQVGDIICFTNGSYSYIGHVGIYIGNGQFIHSSSAAGSVVVTDLDSTYYTNHYYGARRIAV